MNRVKRGNVSLMLFPIGIMILIAILVAIIFLYIQIVVQIYEVKSNLFYIVSSSIAKEDAENLAYRDYTLDIDKMQLNVDKLLKDNYLRDKSGRGIINIQCENIKVMKKETLVVQHTKNKYNTPIICISVRITFRPIISLLGEKVEFNIHDDVKISLLEFGN